MALKSTNIDPAVVELNDRSIKQSKSQLKSDLADTVLDRNWAKRAFLISDDSLENATDVANRYYSSAVGKFTDTSLGGNIGINSKPQFTRYSDVRVKGRLSGRNNVSVESTTGNYGMGRYYSEAIDDPSQTIYLRFGVPEFNSITNFMSKAIDPEMATLARTARAPSIFYNLGDAAGTVSRFIAFPAISVSVLIVKTASSFFKRPMSKFYTLKPSMHLYWSTVNQLANSIAVNAGIMPKVFSSPEEQKIGKPFKLDEPYLDQISSLLPSVFRDNHSFDLYSIANKAQRIANKLIADDFEKLNVGTATDYVGYVKKNVTGEGSHPTTITDVDGNPTLVARLNNIARFSNYKADETSDSSEVSPRLDSDGNQREDLEWFEEFKQDLDSEFRDGSQYAVFKVDHTGSIGESFGNSVAESDLSQKINSTSSSTRQAKFSFANGNIVGEGLQDVAGAVGDTVAGALNGVTFGFSNILTALSGNAYIDIPKYWQSSSANLPKTSYTMKLITPYNNPISQMQNIYIPLSMILAGTLPLSTGKQSYTSPFICSLYDRGRQQVKLGIIDSVSITRGTSNLPFDIEGKSLAVDVTFSVTDLSSIMHMPTSSGGLTDVNMTIDEDNILSDYLNVLAGQSLYNQAYPMSKAKLNLAKNIMNNSKLTSPAYWSSMFHSSSTSGALQYLTLGLGNVLEGAVRGTSLTDR